MALAIRTIGILRAKAQAGLNATQRAGQNALITVLICRRHGINSATFYIWRMKYSGMEASKAKSLRELEAENTKLKRIVADQMLDMTAMKELLSKTTCLLLSFNL